MAVDASAVARVLGITPTYEPRRGGAVLFLPQRIAVFAQGASDAEYSATKYSPLSAGEVGSKQGFGSPAHLIMRELQPANGDGLGSVPVDLYPLVDDDSATAAAGDLTPSGTAVKAFSARLRIGGILSEAFTVAAGAINVSNVLRAIGQSVSSVLHMPVKMTYTYSTVTASAITGTGNGTLTSLGVASGGAPVPGAWRLECITAVSNGGVFRLTDPNGTVVSSALTMTAGVGTATAFAAGGIEFTLTDGTTNFGVGAYFVITVPATKVDFTAKWKGLTGNDIGIEYVGDTNGVTFAITQPTGGLVNPSVEAALAQVGNVWETLGLNAAGGFDDETTLDLFQAFGEGRWGTLTHKPMVVFTGNTETTVAAATTISATRRDDRVNGYLVSPGSPNLPFVVAARQLARIAVMANNNPPTGYAALRATGLIPGADGDQWDYVARDAALKLGCSNVEVSDGVVTIGDVVTFYRPEGEEPPAYRDVVDIVKLQNCIFNIALEFASPSWAAAPLIPDNQPTINELSRKPKSAKSAAAAIVDGLGLQAIISDPATTKAAITANISSSNPKRLDLVVPVKLSGNTSIVNVDLPFSFFFGTPAAA